MKKNYIQEEQKWEEEREKELAREACRMARAGEVEEEDNDKKEVYYCRQVHVRRLASDIC